MAKVYTGNTHLTDTLLHMDHEIASDALLTSALGEAKSDSMLEGEPDTTVALVGNSRSLNATKDMIGK